MKIFISYSIENKTLAEGLESKFRADGIIVYRDKSAARDGNERQEIMYDKIESSDYFVTIWSQSSAKSTSVIEEIVHARRHSKKICLCLLDDTPCLALVDSSRKMKVQNLEDDYKSLTKALNINTSLKDDTRAYTVEHAVEAYKHTLHREHSMFRILYEGNNRPLGEAFVHPLLLPGIDVSTVGASLSLNQLLLYTDENANIICGHPGTGKTSILHYLAHYLSGASLEGSVLPVFARLKRYDPRGGPFDGFLRERIYLKIPPASRSVLEAETSLFDNYYCVFLLDGLDELPAGTYEEVLKDLQRFKKEHKQSKIFLTTRIDNFKGRREEDFQEWGKFTIAPLSLHKIIEFIHVWFNDASLETALVNKFVSTPRLFDLANRPFILALICLVFENEGDLSTKRGPLFEKATSYLLGSRRTRSAVVKLRNAVLKEVAFRFLQMQSKVFEEHLLKTIVSGVILRKTEISGKKVQEFLDDLIRETGIVHHYEGEYQFVHLSFQEYYAALALHDLPNSQDILVDYCQVPGWEEPIRLYAGLISNMRLQEEFVRRLWKRNPALALRTASECDQLAPKFLADLIQNSAATERIRMVETIKTSISSLSELDAQRTTIETLKPLFKYETNSAVLYFGIQLLQEFDPNDEGHIMYDTFWKKAVHLQKKLSADKRYKFEFIRIPAGTFRMGDDSSQDINEQPAHDVYVEEFEIAKYQLTNLAYEVIMGIDSSQRTRYSQDDDQPVVNINWYDAFICAIKVGCRLASEAEWEYAARAGNTGQWCFGDEQAMLPQYAHYYDIKASASRPVGLGLPNAWGLHDVHGNVWEWCADWFGPYSPEPQRNPKGPQTGRFHVRRGGGWLYHARGCRSAFRYGNEPEYRYNDIGTRLARDTEAEKTSK